jgi:deoxyribodipyrimidine photolyase-like uncharacterized protein
LIIRLILGDQLNPKHSWFDSPREDVVYALFESEEELRYAPHHRQKMLAFLHGIQRLAHDLKADGGIVGTKPYVSSGSYLNKQGNHCAKCSYSVTEKVGENACPFNSLYWHFHERNRYLLERNPRIGMVYRTWDKMNPNHRESLLEQAERNLNRINQL